MAVARTRRAHAVGGGGAYRGGACAGQRAAHRRPEPIGADRGRGDGGARPRGTRAQGARLCGAARLGRGCAGALRPDRGGLDVGGAARAASGGPRWRGRPSDQARAACDRPVYGRG